MKLIHFLTHRNSWHSTAPHCCAEFCHYWIVLYVVRVQFFCTTEWPHHTNFNALKVVDLKIVLLLLKITKSFARKNHTMKNRTMRLSFQKPSGWNGLIPYGGIYWKFPCISALTWDRPISSLWKLCHKAQTI